jgi:group I intron endonuclease
MSINKALLKYGYSNFSLHILEYCDKNSCIDREQFYMDLFQPEYNINPTAGSRLGTKHSDESREKIAASRLGVKLTPETREKLSKAKLGLKNNFFGQTHSEFSKKLMSESKMGSKNHFFGQTHSNEARESIRNKLIGYVHSEEIKTKMSKARGFTIFVFSLDKEFLFEFVSSQAAGRYFNCSHAHVMKYTRSGQIFKDQSKTHTMYVLLTYIYTYICRFYL